MLYTLAVILLIAWLLGLVGTYTIGAFVHVLLVAAIILFVLGLFTGRRTVP
jgi:hypothetical protein